MEVLKENRKKRKKEKKYLSLSIWLIFTLQELIALTNIKIVINWHHLRHLQKEISISLKNSKN